MTIAALREAGERELAVAALVKLRPLDMWERRETLTESVRLHVLPGMAVRLSLSVLPDWYLAQWHDPTQFDGRATIESVENFFVKVRGVAPDGDAHGTVLHLDFEEFLKAALDGQIGDAS